MLNDPDRPGIRFGGRFYQHTSHFLLKRAMPYPVGHSEATDARIIHVLGNPEYTEHTGDRHVYWGIIQEQETAPWWLKVVVVENSGGPAILSAYKPKEEDVTE